MFLVLLKFSSNKGQAGQFMDGHKEWIARGFDDGVFLLVGSLQPNSGGGIVPVPVSTTVPSGTELWRCNQSAR